ncbi:hypothetical protein OG203_02300 [Nocardia sp. NBC_01499]|uniref:hypothetical protein n=1 Tax=Nocardia sp. NBC_01499 TaxID=2903597 RepID=UPI003863F4ED
MPHRHSRLVAILGALLIAVGTTGCIGAVDRADFEKTIQARGGGLVSALPATAIDALRQRLGTTEIHASVIVLTAPESHSLTMFDQPPQLSRFLADNPDLLTQDTAAHLRIQVPTHPDQQDDYTFANTTLHGPTPVHVSAFDDPDSEMFDIREVPGLLRLEHVVDTALTQSAVDDGYVSSVVVNRVGPEILMTVNVSSPRTTVVAQFDRAGTFLRMSRA